MKIVLFTPHPINTYGGFEKVASILADYLSKRGVQFQICKLASKSEKVPPQEEWVEPYSSYCKFVLRYDLNYKSKTARLRFFQKLNRWMGNYVIEVDEHANEISDIDLAIVISPFFVKALSEYLKNLGSRAKLITWFHMSLSFVFRGEDPIKNVLRFIIFKVFRIFPKLLAPADFHLAISTGIGNEIKRYCSEASVKIVFNPVVDDDFKVTVPVIAESKENVFAYVGRIDDNPKNLSFMLRGLSRLRLDWKLKVIGTGPDEQKLKRLANKLGIGEKIEWIGFVKDPFKTLEETGVTALLLTSRFEGLPTVLIEALAHGIPVVSSNCETGPEDIVVEGVNGFLFKPGAVNEFVSKVLKIVNGELRHNRPEKIRSTVEKFTISRVCENIYRELSLLLEKTETVAAKD